jgi:hypothetical protein
MSSSSLYLVEKPRLIIRPWVWDKMMFLSKNKDECEVSGLGLIEFQGTDFVVSKMFLVPQLNTKSDTEMDADGIGKAMFMCKDEAGLLKWHWHSHVNMGTFWSPDDRQMIRQNSTHGWFVHTVVNIRGEKKTCIAQQKPFPFFIDDVETIVEMPKYSDEIYKSWDDEYQNNVRISRPHSYEWAGSMNHGYGSTAMTEGSDQAAVEDSRSKGNTVCLPPSQTYGDTLDRHGQQDPKPVGDKGNDKKAECGTVPIIPEDMSNEQALHHLKAKVDRLLAREEELERLHQLNPDDLVILNMWEQVTEDREEYEELVDQMEGFIAQLSSAVTSDEAGAPV